MTAGVPQRRVDQVVHTFREHDAVSDEARLFRDHLRARGFGSSIYAVNAERGVAGDVVPFDTRALAPADALLYHHATVADLGLRLAAYARPKALLYHGVTPPEYLRPYQPALARLLDDGRRALPRIARQFAHRFADSRYGAAELCALAGLNAGVLPFCIDERRFGGAAAASVEASRARGDGVRWLSVGRIAPNKGVLAIVAAFGVYRRRDATATLTLAGAYSFADPYYWAVQRAIDASGVRDRVRLPGVVDDASLLQCYASSDVYVCLSEHEGFCVPLVEAMRFDLPVVALARAAVPETLGEAGIVVEQADPMLVAAVVAAVTSDEPLRERVLAAQRRRREAFRPATTLAVFDRAIDDLLAA